MTMDKRIAVPEGLPNVFLPSKAPTPVYKLPDVLEPDVMTTGEVTLMARPTDERVSNWNIFARNGAALLIQLILLTLYALVLPKLFSNKGPTPEQLEIARDQISWANLPAMNELPKGPKPAPLPPAPKLHIAPGVLSHLPPMPLPTPTPRLPERAPETPAQSSLPAAPTPQPTPTPQHPVDAPTIAPTPHPTNNGLILPRMSSPGRSIQNSLPEAPRGGGAPSIGFEGGPRGGGGGGAPGGGGGGTYDGALQMLTPTEGVDFNSYLQRVLARVRQNWYAVIPESAWMGERGRVVLEFNINRDGSVPDEQPELVSTSEKQELDRAAISSIRASNPFEPLPPAFSGPYIRLRFIYLYNIPLSQAGQ